MVSLTTREFWEDIADEAEKLLAISKGGRNAAKKGHDDEELENDQEVERDETDPYNEVIFEVFGRRRPDSVVVDWAHKVLYCHTAAAQAPLQLQLNCCHTGSSIAAACCHKGCPQRLRYRSRRGALAR